MGVPHPLLSCLGAAGSWGLTALQLQPRVWTHRCGQLGRGRTHGRGQTHGRGRTHGRGQTHSMHGVMGTAGAAMGGELGESCHQDEVLGHFSVRWESCWGQGWLWGCCEMGKRRRGCWR